MCLNVLSVLYRVVRVSKTVEGRGEEYEEQARSSKGKKSVEKEVPLCDGATAGFTYSYIYIFLAVGYRFPSLP